MSRSARALTLAVAGTAFLFATRALAHHAGDDETVLEALLDHAADNWLLLSFLAVLAAGTTLCVRRRRRQGASSKTD